VDELGAVLEAPEVIDEAVEQQGEVTPEGEGAVETPEEAKEETPADWRKVPAELKEFFKTPAGKAAKDAWFERNAYKEKFPEGIKQVNELTAFLDEHGGREGLTTALGELTGKAAELDGIAAKMQSGDPSLISDLVQNSPDGFAKLAPVVAQEWARVDPEGWGAAMSGVMAATIAHNQVPMFLERMGMMLEFGKVEDATAMLGKLKDWANGFAEKASAPRTQQTNGQPDKLSQREQELNQREQQAFTNDMKRDVDSFRSPLITKELDSFFKRRPNDSEAKDLAISTVRSQVVERMAADKDFQSKLNALTARKDRDGAMRLIKSRETAAITEIAPKVGRMIFGNPGPVKVEAKTAPTPIRPKVEAKVDPRDAVMNRIFGR
jgi:hypothetical protein